MLLAQQPLQHKGLVPADARIKVQCGLAQQLGEPRTPLPDQIRLQLKHRHLPRVHRPRGAHGNQVLSRQAGVLQAQRLEALVAGFLEPLWQTPAIWHPGPARTVIRALVPRLSAELRRDAVQRINRNLEEASGPLLQALPHLDRDTLQVRLQLLAGAADELRLHARDLGLFPLRGAVDGGHEQALQRELLAMSLATLKMRPSVPGNGGQVGEARSNTLGEPGKRSAR